MVVYHKLAKVSVKNVHFLNACFKNNVHTKWIAKYILMKNFCVFNIHCFGDPQTLFNSEFLLIYITVLYLLQNCNY